jgi:large subunit ribosomal protein L22
MSKVRKGKVISPVRLERKGGGGSRKRVYPEGRYGATLRNIHLAPNKMRLVMDLIRGQSVERARELLRFSRKRAAYYVDRVLLSALGNADARTEGRIGAAELVVSDAYCDEGTRMKRWKAGPMGRSRPIIRRLCHLTVVLGEPDVEGNGDAGGAKETGKAKKSKAKAGKAGKSGKKDTSGKGKKAKSSKKAKAAKD